MIVFRQAVFEHNFITSHCSDLRIATDASRAFGYSDLLI